ncbi:MAG: hypothetical protein KZQ83_14790 [gamma proteobacterium symbiont of Taylorina sp.]|nr:hypothetical protein [gamma proteobacterium symbiont of Taylorina sp.]
MCIEELTKKAKNFLTDSTPEEQVRLLRDAKIIDNDGFLHPDYFSKETVANNRAENKPFTC